MRIRPSPLVLALLFLAAVDGVALDITEGTHERRPHLVVHTERATIQVEPVG